MPDDDERPLEPSTRDPVAHASYRRQEREQNLHRSGEMMEHQRQRQRRADAAARAVATGAPRSQADQGELATFGEVFGRPQDISALYGALIARASERLALYSRQLAAAFAAEGNGALVGSTWAMDSEGNLQETGEKPRALVEMERAAASDLQKLITDAMKLKIDAESGAAKGRYTAQMVAVLRHFTEATGQPWNQETKRLAQAAIVAARQSGDVPTTD